MNIIRNKSNCFVCYEQLHLHFINARKLGYFK